MNIKRVLNQCHEIIGERVKIEKSKIFNYSGATISRTIILPQNSKIARMLCLGQFESAIFSTSQVIGLNAVPSPYPLSAYQEIDSSVALECSTFKRLMSALPPCAFMTHFLLTNLDP